VVFPLDDASESPRGISGSVVVCEDGVLGLAHFARDAGPEKGREVYVIPLSLWARDWSALAALFEPLVDAPLRVAATARRARVLDAGIDVVIAGDPIRYYLERPVDALTRDVLDRQGGLVIVGRPKSGKTRMAWELLRANQEWLVVIPHADRPQTSSRRQVWPATIWCCSSTTCTARPGRCGRWSGGA
jgi:hypothetical protein